MFAGDESSILDESSVSTFEKRVGVSWGNGTETGYKIFCQFLGLESGGWWVPVTLGLKKAQIWPKIRGPYLCQKWELGQTKDMYGGLLGQTNLLVALF